MKQEDPIISRLQLPWLMLPCDHQNEADGEGEGEVECQQRRCFNIFENKSLYLSFSQARMKCVGSSRGWLVIVEDFSPAIFMLNPLTKERIDLPHVTTMPGILSFNKDDVGCEYIRECVFTGTIERASLEEIARFYPSKVILSNDPGDDCIVVALCGWLNQLVFCRIGDRNWTQVDHELKPPQSDVVYSKSKFYFVNCMGVVRVFDGSNPQATIIYQPPPDIDVCDKMYLAVDTNGLLLHISRWVHFYYSLSEAERENADANNVDNEVMGDGNEGGGNNNNYAINQALFDKMFYRTKRFNIYQLNEKKNGWNKLTDIGDNIVFLGDNQSICYSASEFPECNKNSIYFTDDNRDYAGKTYGGHDVGIFNIDDGLIRKIPFFEKEEPLKNSPRPVWYTPSIQTAFN